MDRAWPALRRIAVETQQRGHHAFGLAWLDDQGIIHTFKRPGPATANLGDLDACRGATIVIGHCRYATHGHPMRQPATTIPIGPARLVGSQRRGIQSRRTGALASPQATKSVRQRSCSACSWPVFHRYAGTARSKDRSNRGSAAWRCSACGESRPDSSDCPPRQPALLCRDQRRILYFGSLPDELPGQAKAITDNYVGVLTF